jgi:hypothetical protein
MGIVVKIHVPIHYDWLMFMRNLLIIEINDYSLNF